MPLFIVHCRDKADAGDLRMETRPAHLDYLEAAGDRVLLAGPILDDASKPIGSLLVIEAETKDAAAAFATADPYAKAGLFQSTEIEGYKIALGMLAPT